jgi:hypothetical protein
MTAIKKLLPMLMLFNHGSLPGNAILKSNKERVPNLVHQGAIDILMSVCDFGVIVPRKYGINIKVVMMWACDEGRRNLREQSYLETIRIIEKRCPKY